MIPTTMTRYEPWDIWNDFNSLMGTTLGTSYGTPLGTSFGGGKSRSGTLTAAQAGYLAPAVDITETDKQFLVHADLPGVGEEDIQIFVDELNNFTIRGTRQARSFGRGEGSGSGGSSLRSERSFGTFSRSFTLPYGVDSKGISATFKDGVLEVTIPKQAKTSGERIKIQRG